jgi:genome maintenance exonuclease 1
MKFIKSNNNVQITDLKKVNKYPYKKYNRFTDEKGRKYLVQEQKVPSVTTILGKTKDRTELDAWVKRVGVERARQITQNAAAVGEEMHYILENYFNGTPYYNADPNFQQPLF